MDLFVRLFATHIAQPTFNALPRSFRFILRSSPWTNPSDAGLHLGLRL